MIRQSKFLSDLYNTSSELTVITDSPLWGRSDFIDLKTSRYPVTPTSLLVPSTDSITYLRGLKPLRKGKLFTRCLSQRYWAQTRLPSLSCKKISLSSSSLFRNSIQELPLQSRREEKSELKKDIKFIC